MSVISKLLELGASTVEIAEIIDETKGDLGEEKVYDALKRINPELAESFRREMSLFVWRTDLRREPFTRTRIIKSLIKETGVSKALAEKIAREVEERIRSSNLSFITSSLIRELVLIKLIEYGMEDAYRKYARLGIPIYDLSILSKKEDVERNVAQRILLQYSILYLLPRELVEALFEGVVRIGGISNPFVPYAVSYYTRASEERWLNGLMDYITKREFVDVPSIYVPPFAQEGPLMDVLQAIKKSTGAILWSEDEIEGVEQSPEPLYSFGSVPDRKVLDYIEIDAEKASIVYPSPQISKKMEEISEAIFTYQERRRKFIRGGNIYVKLLGPDKFREYFSNLRLL